MEKEFKFKDVVIAYREINTNNPEISLGGFKPHQKACIIDLVQNESSDYSKGEGSQAMRNFFAQMAKEKRFNIYTFAVFSEEYFEDEVIDNTNDIERTLGRLVNFYTKLGFTDLVGYSTQEDYVDLCVEIDSMGIPIGVTNEIKEQYLNDIKDDLYNILKGSGHTKSEISSNLKNISELVDILDTPEQVYDFVLNAAEEDNQKRYEVKEDEFLKELSLLDQVLSSGDGSDDFISKTKEEYNKIIKSLYTLSPEYAKRNDKYSTEANNSISSIIGDDESNLTTTQKLG